MVAVIFPSQSQADITGHWEFDGDLSATIGQDLEWTYLDGIEGTEFGTTSGLGIPLIDGQEANVLKFPDATDVSDFGGIQVRHGAQPATEDDFLVNAYTLVMDVLFPEASNDGNKHLLVQYFNDIPLVRINNQNQLGGRNFFGRVTPDTWHRLAVTVDHSIGKARYYIDGVKVGEDNIGGTIDGFGSHSLEEDFYLFHAFDLSKGGYINSLQFSDTALPESVIAELGTPKAPGIPAEEPVKPYVVSVAPPSTSRLRPVPSDILPNVAIQAVWQDGQASTVSGSFAASLNGNDTPVSVSKSGELTTVIVNYSGLLDPVAEYRVIITGKDTEGNDLMREWIFSVTDYVNLDPALARSSSSGLRRGFLTRSAQAPEDSEIGSDIRRAINQLAGTLVDKQGTPVADQAFPGDLESGYSESEIIDFELNGDPFGNFESFEFFPGIPGEGDHTSLFSTEVIGYLELDPGFYQMGVNVHVSQPDKNDNDNWRMYIGNPSSDLFAESIGSFELTLQGFVAGPNDNLFEFFVTEEGYYPFRLVYWNKGSGAGLELYSVNTDNGEKLLINDPDDNAAIRAFYATSDISQPFVISASPIPGTSGNDPAQQMQLIINDPKNRVDTSRIELLVDGKSSELEITRNNGLLYINRPLGLSLASEAEVDASLKLFNSQSNLLLQRDYSFKVNAGKQIQVTGYWDFENKLQAVIGTDLSYLDGAGGATEGATEFGTTSSLGVDDLPDGPAPVMKVGAVGANPNFGFLANHGVSPNGGGSFANQYSLIYDIYFTGVGNGWASLANFDASGDGDIFWRRSDGGLGQGGGGYEPDDPSVKINRETWHRIVLSFDLATGKYHKYVDGVYHSSQDNGGLDGRQAARQAIWLFNDNDGENGEVLVSAIQFRDGFMTDQDAAALGGPSAAGIPLPVKAQPIRGLWTFENGDLSGTIGSDITFLDGPEGTTAGATEFGSATSFGIDPIHGADGMVMKIGHVGANANFGYILDHRIAPNGGGSRVNQYALVYDIYFSGTGNGWASLANLDNSGDGDVFWRRSDGGLGQGGGGYEPDDPAVKVNRETWHRVILSFDLASGTYDKYVDGAFHSTQANAGLDGRQSLKETLWLFNDNDGENGEIYLNSLAIYDRPISPDEARAFGRAQASGIPRNIPEPQPLRGLWTFDQGDLSADIGKDLAFLDGPGGDTDGATEFGSTDAFGIEGPRGGSAHVMKVGHVGSNANFGYLLSHGIAPNGGGAQLNQYTLVFDAWFSGVGGGWASLANFDTSGDGDVFWRRSDGGLGQGGGGYEPVDPSVKVNRNTWHRIILSFDLAAGTYDKYIDGNYHSSQANGGLDGRQAARPSIWLFNDNDGENGEVYVDAIAIYDRPLTPDEARALGGVTASGIPAVIPPPAPIRGLWQFDNNDLTATIGRDLSYLDGNDGATAGATEFGTTESFEIEGILGESANVMKVGHVGSNPDFGFLMNHGIAPNGGGAKLNHYSLVYDLYFSGVGGGWASLANLDTSGDGDVFWRRSDGGLGQGGGGYEPVDPEVKVNRESWHRIILAFDLASGTYDKYVDGIYHSSQDNGGLDGRQSAGPSIWLFNDNDGENGEVYVNSLAIFDKKLTAEEAAILGRPKAAGIPDHLNDGGPVDPQPLNLSASLDGQNLIIQWDGNGGQLESATDINGPWVPVEQESPASIPVSANSEFFRITR